MKQFILPLLLSSLILSACLPQPQNGASTTTPSAETPQSQTQSLRDLLASGVTQKCTWESTTESGQSTGTLYTNGSRFRQEITTTTTEGSTTFNAVSDGEYMYTWGDSATGQGMKIKLDAAETSPSDTDSQPVSGTVGLDEQVSFNCSPVVLSGVDFDPPSTIEFVDLSETMNNLQQQFQNLDLDSLQNLAPVQE